MIALRPDNSTDTKVVFQAEACILCYNYFSTWLHISSLTLVKTTHWNIQPFISVFPTIGEDMHFFCSQTQPSRASWNSWGKLTFRCSLLAPCTVVSHKMIFLDRKLQDSHQFLPEHLKHAPPHFLRWLLLSNHDLNVIKGFSSIVQKTTHDYVSIHLRAHLWLWLYKLSAKDCDIFS